MCFSAYDEPCARNVELAELVEARKQKKTGSFHFGLVPLVTLFRHTAAPTSCGRLNENVCRCLAVDISVFALTSLIDIHSPIYSAFQLMEILLH